MTIKKHKKHTKLIRPTGGKFHWNELAFLGAPCSLIQEETEALAALMKQTHRIAYVDSSHEEKQITSSFRSVFVDEQSALSLTFVGKGTDFSRRSLFSDCDLVFVNGNHAIAEHQIVFIHSKKEASLLKKMARLSNVLAFVLCDREAPYSYLEKLEKFTTIPVFKLDEREAIRDLIEEKFPSNQAALKGLVLAGGKSTRMGFDKGGFEYHGKAQREYMADVLNKLCSETFISVREAKVDFESSYPLLVDTFSGLGPYGGILSAFRSDPNSAWLTVATDVPLIDENLLSHLIAQRDVHKMATCFHNPETDFPEPLITIWEPRAYPRLLEFLCLGYSCPRKALINSEIHEIEVHDPKVLSNANTPEELEKLQAEIRIQ